MPLINIYVDNDLYFDFCKLEDKQKKFIRFELKRSLKKCLGEIVEEN